MNIKVCLVFILLSFINTDVVNAAVSGTTCSAEGNECDVLTNAECDTGSSACKCKDEFTENNSDQCQADVTDAACVPETKATTTDCTTINNAECIGTNQEICVCKIGTTHDNGVCTLGLDENCAGGLICTTTNAECTSDTCSCESGFAANNGACDRVLGSACSDTAACPGLSNSICSDGTCQCAPKYVEVENVCELESGAASTKAMILMMFSVFLIRLVDKLLM